MITKDLVVLITEVSSPVFALLSVLDDEESSVNVIDSLRNDMEATFVQLERRLFEKQISAACVHDIKYALAALADERVMTSRWQGKFTWMTQPLVVAYFGDSIAGKRFFEKLNDMQSNFEENLPIIRLYFSVLQLGFQGQYRLDGYEHLQAYIAKLHVALDKHIGPMDRTLADEAVPEAQVVYRITGQRPYWMMLAVAITIVLGATAGFSYKTQQAIETSADTISALRSTSHYTLSVDN